MRADCKECGAKLIGDDAREVGYCVPCYNMLMSDGEEEEYRDDNRAEIESLQKQCDELKSLLLESWQMWKNLAEAGELKIGPNYWVRYAEMKLKVEAITEK